MTDARARRSAARRRGRRLGWMSVLVSLSLNFLLFSALVMVNKRFEDDVEDIAVQPIDVYVRPEEVDELPDELEPEELEPELVEAELIEPLETMLTPLPLAPRIEVDLPDFSDPAALSMEVSDLPIEEPLATEAPMELPNVDSPPKRTAGVFPPYPAWAQRRALEGTATVQFIVNADGSVRDVRVTFLRGDERFRAVAVDAIRQWRFKPAVYRGEPVPVRCIQKLSFKLQG